MINVGDTFVTAGSFEKVTALEVNDRGNGIASVRVLRADGSERWTSVKEG